MWVAVVLAVLFKCNAFFFALLATLFFVLATPRKELKRTTSKK